MLSKRELAQGFDSRLSALPSALADLVQRVRCGDIGHLVLNKNDKILRANRLTRVGAWIDATLAVLDLELPSWKLRRIQFEDGLWICSLSQRPQSPLQHDDMAEAQNEELRLAIVGAMVEAHRLSVPRRPRATKIAPQLNCKSTGIPLDCDDFA
jgi:hypothetical protein